MGKSFKTYREESPTGKETTPVQNRFVEIIDENYDYEYRDYENNLVATIRYLINPPESNTKLPWSLSMPGKFKGERYFQTDEEAKTSMKKIASGNTRNKNQLK